MMESKCRRNPSHRLHLGECITRYPIRSKIINHIQSTGLADPGARRQEQATNSQIQDSRAGLIHPHRITDQTMAPDYKNKELNASTLIHSNTFIYLHPNLLYSSTYSVFCHNVRLQHQDESFPRREYLFFLLITFVTLIHHRTSRSNMLRRTCIAPPCHSFIPTPMLSITSGYVMSSK